MLDRRIGSDLDGLASEARDRDVKIEILGHFMSIDPAADRERDLRGAAQLNPSPCDGCLALQL
jgi:hypothetical protein